MTTKLVWRLKEQPSTKSLQELVVSGVLTKEEAREILFSSQEENERDTKSLENEIKFLRDLVEKLAQNRSQIVEVIKEVQIPYYNYDWYKPYHYYCGAGDTITLGASGTTTSTDCSFNSIDTF